MTSNPAGGEAPGPGHDRPIVAAVLLLAGLIFLWSSGTRRQPRSPWTRSCTLPPRSPGTYSRDSAGISRWDTRCSSVRHYMVGIPPGTALDRGPRVRPAPAGGPGRGAGRGAIRADRAAGAAARRGGHHRDLLHLPADGLQLQVHRRIGGYPRAVPDLGAGDYNNPSTTWRSPSRPGRAVVWLIYPQVRPAAACYPGRRGPGAGLGVRAMRVKQALS